MKQSTPTLRALLTSFAMLSATAVACCCAAPLAQADALYREPFRPQFHFSPPAQWMNDPNGMVYWAGEYHLFYQYHPASTVWGPMHWGHAISKDLLHWRQQPIALYPDRHGAIFSGSVVVDRGNTSGLGTVKNPPLVAIFTHHDMRREKQGAIDIESQGMAYSLDHGRTWVKYAHNPVLPNPGLRDFRDPKVFWFEPQHKWVMTLAVKDHVSFYSSKDLQHWVHESDFGHDQGAHGGVWECPDLVEMVIAGESTRRFVLLASVNPGAPNGGSGTQYFIGGFDGHEFTLDAEQQRIAKPGSAHWLDVGTDHYAAVTWSGLPAADGRVLLLGWMSNWTYAQIVPTTRWRSAMTLPRELALVRTARGLEVQSRPAPELKALRIRSEAIPAARVAVSTELVKPAFASSGLLELSVAINAPDEAVVTLAFRNRAGETTLFRVNRKQHRYELDRSRSGLVSFSPAFAALQTAPMPAGDGRISLQVFVDRSSLEVFINGGETVFTALVFPQTPYDSVELSADRDFDLTSGSVSELKSICGATP